MQELAQVIETTTCAKVTGGKQGAKELAAALKRLGMAKKHSKAGNVWAAAPERAQELLNRIRQEAELREEAAKGKPLAEVIPLNPRGPAF